MSLKINEMRKCHPHQGFWRRGEVGDFTSRDAGEPKRLNPRCSNQIRGFWPKRTQGSYLPWNLSVTARIGPFFSKFECAIARPIKDSVLGILRCSLPSLSRVRSRIRSLESFDAPSHPSVKRDWRKVAGRRSAAWGWTRAPRKPWQDASATTEDPAGCLWK